MCQGVSLEQRTEVRVIAELNKETEEAEAEIDVVMTTVRRSCSPGPLRNHRIRTPEGGLAPSSPHHHPPKLASLKSCFQKSKLFSDFLWIAREGNLISLYRHFKGTSQEVMIYIWLNPSWCHRNARASFFAWERRKGKHYYFFFYCKLRSRLTY